MKARKLRPGQIVCPYATLIILNDVSTLDGVTRLTGRVIRHGGEGPVTAFYDVDADADVKLCTWEGTEKEGKSKGEVRAEDYYRRLRRANVEATLTVEESPTRTTVTLTIKAKTIYDDSHTGMWFTWKVGRKTTQFAGFVSRGICRGRKRSVAKRTGQQFHDAVSNACWLHEYEVRKAAEAKENAA